MTTNPTLTEVEPTMILAAVGTVTDHGGIPTLLVSLLDQAWAHIRGSGLEGAGHNVVIYRNQGNELTGGVQVPADTPEPAAPLVLATTPGGTAATLRHIGPYAQIPQSVQRLFGWCGENGHPVTEPMWEVYGDWEEDETKAVTDLFVSIAVS